MKSVQRPTFAIQHVSFTAIAGDDSVCNQRQSLNSSHSKGKDQLTAHRVSSCKHYTHSCPPPTWHRLCLVGFVLEIVVVPLLHCGVLALEPGHAEKMLSLTHGHMNGVPKRQDRQEVIYHERECSPEEVSTSKAEAEAEHDQHGFRENTGGAIPKTYAMEMSPMRRLRSCGSAGEVLAIR